MNISVGTVNRKLAIVFVGAVGAILWLRFGFLSDRAVTPTVTVSETVPQAERRLQKLRLAASTVPGKEEILKKAAAELAEREKGVLQAPTEPQAQAQLLEILSRLARRDGIATQGGDFHDKPLTKEYGQVSVTVRFTCGIEQLVNLMADLADQPQILSTEELRINGGTDKNKNVQVLLTVAGVVPRKLLPDKKGGTLF